jgi:hypothetical protein
MARNWMAALSMLALLAFGCTDYDLAEDDGDYLPGQDDDDSPSDDDTGHEETGDDDTEGTDVTADDDFEPQGDDDDDDTSGDPVGRVVTILLTLNDMYMDQGISAQLLVNSVEWVTPTGIASPEVLVIRDDNHSGEHPEDSEHIRDTLVAAGYAADLIDEPGNGITQQDLAGYEVAILSNPGHSPDDLSTLQALYQFSVQGYGLIFQGDDMAAFDDGSFSMQSLTRLSFIDNGTEYHGYHIDNDNGDLYAVELPNDSHPILDGIAGYTFHYGDDIDTTAPAHVNEEILGWATVDGTNGIPTKPVIAAYSQ